MIDKLKKFLYGFVVVIALIIMPVVIGLKILIEKLKSLLP